MGNYANLKIFYAIMLPYDAGSNNTKENKVDQDFFNLFEIDNYEELLEKTPGFFSTENEIYFYGIILDFYAYWSKNVKEPSIEVKNLILNSFKESKVREKFFPEFPDEDFEVEIYYIPSYS